MKNNKNKKIDTNENKQESELVTKESFSAVFALFSLIALLILFTKSFIFGNLGVAVHAFLTGTFGYFAYPLFLASLYFFSMALIGKRLVKNRKAGTCVALSIIFIGLILHTAFTYSWSLEGYMKACFEAGMAFPAATAMGWVGSALVFVVSSIVSKLGAIVFFAALALFCGYLAIIFKKKSQKQAVKQEEAKYDIPVMQPIQQPAVTDSVEGRTMPSQEPVAQNVYGGYTQPQVQQRPGVMLSDEPAQTNGAFSPFGTPQAMQEKPSNWLEKSYDNSREFLFGTTPAENYKKNLIFDPNSSANRRPPVDPYQTTVASGYTPSYSDAYENSVNNREEQPPMKIVTDNTYDYRSADYESEEPVREEPTPSIIDTRQTPSYSNPYGLSETITPIEPMQPMEDRTPIEPMSSYEERSSFLNVSEPAPREPEFGRRDSFEIMPEERFAESREESFIKEPEETPYQRHEYMGLFSTDNPNVFGREDRESVLNTDTFSRESERESRWETGPNPFDTVEDDRSFVDRGREESRGERDALSLFDETPEDNPYSLRSDFDEPKSDRGAFGSDREVPYSDMGREYTFDRENTPAATGFNDRGFEEVPLTPSRTERIEPVAQPQRPMPPKTPKPRIPKPYVRISLDDLDCRDIEPTANQADVEETKETIIATLEDFKVTGASIASVTFGPTVTRYNVTLPRSISPRKVVALDQSISISLHANGVNIYPNYEDGVVSIEVPNRERQFVQLGCMLSGDTYVNAKSSSLMFAMGKDVANRKIYGDISKMIHLLVAGASGSGKSVFLGSLIISLIHKYSPEELRLILIDPKKTEFVLYNDLPHLMINEIITDVGKAVQSLNWAIEEMNRRYGLFQEMTRAGTYVVNLDQYNAQMKKHDRLPKIVIIIDELADLMLAAKKDIEDRIQNLTQKARAAGIHIIVATQRPSTDVITGVIKSNLPTRVAFGVATDVDSRVILDQGGAQKLLGKGDFLYTMQGINTPVRVQSAFISPEESLKVVNFIKANNEAYYDEEATAYINNTKSSSSGGGFGGGGEKDIEPVYIEALKYVIISGSASISMIQRKCSAGYNKAGRIIEWMEDMGYISAFDGAKARKVLITKEEFESKYGPM